MSHYGGISPSALVLGVGTPLQKITMDNVCLIAVREMNLRLDIFIGHGLSAHELNYITELARKRCGTITSFVEII